MRGDPTQAGGGGWPLSTHHNIVVRYCALGCVAALVWVSLLILIDMERRSHGLLSQTRGLQFLSDIGTFRILSFALPGIMTALAVTPVLFAGFGTCCSPKGLGMPDTVGSAVLGLLFARRPEARAKPTGSSSGHPAKLLAVVALLLAGCSTSESTSDASVDSADAALERRYLQACTEDSISGDARVTKATCDCTLKAARKLYSRSELDMFVARRTDDKVREKEILSRPDYDEKKFAGKARELQGQALTCTLSRVVR